MGTSIHAARSALYDRLAVAPGLAGKQVTFGDPLGYTEKEVVALLGVEDPNEEPRSLGQLSKEEEYTLVVAIKVHDPAASDGRDVDERGYGLADVVRDEVHPANKNLTLGNTVSTALVESITSDGAFPAKGGGWIIYLEVRVRCHANIAWRRSG